MREWKPGTVAVVTLNGEEFRAMRTGTPSNMGWEVVRPSSRYWVGDASEFGRVTDVRPLVVLDLAKITPAYADRPAHLVAYLRSFGSRTHDSIADQIEAQTKPPRIPEPGLWGVVEAHNASHRIARKWVRYGTGWRDAFDYHEDWDELIDPVLIREGVES